MDKSISQVKEAVDSLYTTFLARDLFSKVVPGGLVLATIVAVMGKDNAVSGTLPKISFLGWLLVYALCFSIGLAVQAVGEYLKIIRAYPGDESEDTFRTRMKEFNDSIPSNVDRIQRERYVVIKETTGNFGVAILISILILGVGCLLSKSTWVLYPAFGVPSFLVVWWFHVVHQRRQRDWERKVINRKTEAKQNKEGLSS